MLTRRFNRVFEVLLGHEGGYVCHPDDPGGETCWGISKRSYPDEDIKNLTQGRAKAIYLNDYWLPECDKMPADLALLFFDCCVNNGRPTAVRWLQEALGVKADGILGPFTMAAIADTREVSVAERFHVHRAHRMTRMRNWPAFGRGWTMRLVELPFQAQALVEWERARP